MSCQANKLAMSRALGAAFLTHQVEQLEKSVSAPPRNNNNYNPSHNTNWRERQRSHPQPTDSRRGQLPVGGIKFTTITNPATNQPYQRDQKERPMTVGAGPRKRGAEDPHPRRGGAKDKDADVIVVDASVLVNALGQLKKWCRDGQEEIIIVPLEVRSARSLADDDPALAPLCPDSPALNTLDLLKKGSTPLAQRARTASRMLESQVGTNPRVRVQQDAAFVLWDQIAFSDDEPSSPTTPSPAPAPAPSPSPEWVRRTICCARWEVEHADAARPRVVLATLAQSPATQPQQGISPVPLPLSAPQNRHEPRASGTLVAYWARRARLTVLEVSSSPGGGGGGGAPDSVGGRAVSPEGRWSANHHHGHRGGRGGGGGGGMVERPPAVKAMMDVIAQPSRVKVKSGGKVDEPNRNGPGRFLDRTDVFWILEMPQVSCCSSPPRPALFGPCRMIVFKFPWVSVAAQESL
ncbi:hypothetical protein EDB86DRAFT_2837598 [Lactarius hatsudake]|nr:hypothetical protein EDB86DRAFT_2837598 [Lactarius hatsudake]